MNETLSSILTVVVPTVVSAAVGFAVGKKKYNAEAESTELDNVEKALAIYRGMIQDLIAQVKELKGQVEHLEKLVEEYKQQLKN